MNWTLISVAVLIAVMALIGLKKGLIKMLFSMLSIVVIIILTSIVTPIAAKAIKSNTNMYNEIYTRAEASLKNNGVLKYSDEEIDKKELPLSISANSKIKDQADQYIAKGYEEYNKFIVTSVADMVFSLIIYVSVFLLISLILGIIGGVLNIVSKLPVLKQINHGAGFVVGLVTGVIIVWIAFLVVTLFNSYEITQVVMKQIEDSAILTFLYKNNVLLMVICSFF